MLAKTESRTSSPLKSLGFDVTGQVHRNLKTPVLYEKALQRNEGELSDEGALCARTGQYTGRSPKDKFIAKDEAASAVNWGSVNQPLSPEYFNTLLEDVGNYLAGREHFVFDGLAGAAPEYQLPISVVNELAWQNLFVRQLFIRPTAEQLERHEAQFTILCAPGFTADPKRHGVRSEAFVALSFSRRLILIGGTHYAGEMKKSIFTVLNYLLPARNVLPMHCGANIGDDGRVALFFGLSGTGKTTLSADPNRRLLGDDEHGWSPKGTFNFEGGCYAKCINLSEAKEPQIWNSIRFGTVLENVMLDPETRTALYDDDRYTENTRAAYPIDFIPGADLSGMAGHPTHVFFLTADAFGVLPPISRLSAEQAMYHFLSGYTSKLAGTERGVTEPEATFSTCFGEPFLPRSPQEYAELLGTRVEQHKAQVFLVNTGWTGGPHGVGHRMDLPYTRAMVQAALAGALDGVAYETDPFFGLSIPKTVPGVPSDLLVPKNTWADKEAYDRKAKELAGLFRKNFTRFGNVSEQIANAAPMA